MDEATSFSDRHLQALKKVVGDKYVREDRDALSPYLRDWSGDYIATPLCVIFPETTAEVSSIVNYCHRHGLYVVPQGGNTGLVGGCFTSDSSGTLIVNLGRMNKIEVVDAIDYTMEVEAGAILQDIQDRATAADRLFPLSFGAQGSAQIGGAIATNAGGLNVLRYGMTRDLVLGLEVVLPDGKILSRLSRLRKDNSGLDLKQLFVGSEGTLGIVTRASLKLFPLPTRKETVLLALSNEHDVLSLYTFARTHCTDLMSAFELIPRRCLELALEHQTSLRDPLSDKYETYVLMELAASGPIDLRSLLESLLETAMENGLVLDGALAESVAHAESFWAIREAMVEAQAARGPHLRTDISVPISQIPQFIDKARETVARIAPGWEVIAYGHVGDGNVHFNVLPPEDADDAVARRQIPEMTSEIYANLAEFDGSVSAEHGIGRSRKATLLVQKDETERALAQAIKSLIDGTNTMNPGCLFDAN